MLCEAHNLICPRIGEIAGLPYADNMTKLLKILGILLDIAINLVNGMFL